VAAVEVVLVTKQDQDEQVLADILYQMHQQFLHHL
jgi:hypothetical protein